MTKATETQLIAMLYELCGEFGEVLEGKFPQAAPYLPRILIWLAARRITLEHGENTAMAVLRQIADQIEAGEPHPGAPLPADTPPGAGYN